MKDKYTGRIVSGCIEQAAWVLGIHMLGLVENQMVKKMVHEIEVDVAER